jgi:hypothetical protein
MPSTAWAFTCLSGCSRDCRQPADFAAGLCAGLGADGLALAAPAQAAELLFQLIVGAGVGMGVRTCLAFFSLLLFGAHFGGLLWVELLLAAGLWGLVLRAGRAAPRPAGAFWPRPSAWGWGLLGCWRCCPRQRPFSYLGDGAAHAPRHF